MAPDRSTPAERVIARAEANLAKNPLDPEALQRVGKAYIRAGRWADAQAVLRLAITEDPTDPWHRLFLGNSLYRQNDFPAAIDAFTQAQRLSPDLVSPYICIADAYAEMGERRKAGRMYRKAVEIEPDDPAANKNLARWKQLEAQWSEDEAEQGPAA